MMQDLGPSGYVPPRAVGSVVPLGSARHAVEVGALSLDQSTGSGPIRCFVTTTGEIFTGFYITSNSIGLLVVL